MTLDDSTMKELVDRFLQWPLPVTVCSDTCVTIAGYTYPRSGTNLLSAFQAEHMLRHVLAALSQPAPMVAQEAQTEREAYWLIERRCSPPQWAMDSRASIGSFGSDVHRAYRWPTKQAAREAMRLMPGVLPEERGEYFVAEHVWIDGEPLAKSPEALLANVEHLAMQCANAAYPEGHASREREAYEAGCSNAIQYAAALAQPTASAGVREAIAEAIRAEIYRQCEIGAGVAVEDHDTGLFEVNADLDVDGGFTNAILTALNLPVAAEPSGEH